MKLSGRKRHLVAALLAVAVIIAVGGIGKFHSSPFTMTLRTDCPVAWTADHSTPRAEGFPCAIADRSGRVLLIMDGKGRLQRTVKVSNADHPYDRITLLHASDDRILANVITMEGQHIVHEQIRLYDRKGRCVRTASDSRYTGKTIFEPRNQSFIQDGDGVSVVRIEENVLQTVLLGRDSTTVTESICLDEPLVEVRPGLDSALYVSGLYGKIYRYVPGSGYARSVRLSDEDYVSIIMDDSIGIASVPCSPLYAAANILFWISLLIIAVAVLGAAWWFFRHKYSKTAGAVIAGVLLAAGIVAFYTHDIYRQTREQLTRMMVYQTDLLAYVTGENYLGLVQALSADDTGDCLSQPEVMDQLSDLHTILDKSSRFDGNEYYVSVVYSKDSISRQLVDNKNLTSTGRPAYDTSLKWDSPSSDGTDIITAFNEKLHYTVRNITDRTGKIVAKVVSVFPDQLLRSAQKGKAFRLFLSLLSILIGLYTLFIFIDTIRRSISGYSHRRRTGLPYASEQLFPTFYSLIVWFREVDRTLMVFIIPYFTAGGSIGDVASVTAIVLMVYSIGSIVMVPFTKVAYSRFGVRNVGIAAACVNLLSYVLMIVALKSTEVNLFYVAKFLSGASAGNVLTVVSHSLGASVKDKDTRAALFNEKQTAGNTINVLAILGGGYIIQYLSPVVLYVVAILLAVLLIGVSVITLSGLSKADGGAADRTPSWRDMVASFKFFALKDGMSVVFLVLLPTALMFGYLDFIFPLYASECGMTPLMLSNIMVIGLALNLLLRKPLNSYYASVGTKRALTVQFVTISAALLMLAVSPNIIWMVAICIVIYVLKMNSCVSLYQVEMIERNGFRQQDVQSDFLLADQAIRAARMPFINLLVQAGRISACIWIGIICGILAGGLGLSGRKRR